MKNFIKNLAIYTTSKPFPILFLTLLIIVLASFGISNFKLDASSDALVLDGDEAFKTYRKNEKEFGDSSFLIVTYEPDAELKRIEKMKKNLETQAF